jgi:WD40 repeat protein
MILKIFANEIPWGDIDYARLVELVVVRDFRPERPDVEDAPLLSDAVWELAGKCWVKDPKHRLTAMAVCDTISCLLNTVTQTTGQPISSPPHSINLPQPAPQLHTLDQATPTLAHALTPLHSVLHNTSNARHMPDASSSRNVILAGSKPLPPIPIKNMTCRGHTNWVYSAAFSPDGKYIVSGSVDCTIIIWDAQRGDIFLEPHKMHTEGVASVAFSPDNRQIASGSIDTTILVWDSMKGEVVAGPLRGHTDAVWSVSFSSDGKKIASGSWDHTIRIWDVQTGSLLLGPIVGHTDKVNTVTFSGDGKQIVSGSSDKTLSVWDAISGIQIHRHLTAHQNLVRFAAFSSDGKRIVSAWDGNVCAWDTHTGALISGPSKQHPKGTLDVIFMAHSTYYCAVSPDGKWIVGLKDGDRKIIQVWDSMTGLLVDKFSEHTNEVLSVCFSPNSKQILSTSQDTTVQVHTLNL